jgi:hypothetical protein
MAPEGYPGRSDGQPELAALLDVAGRRTDDDGIVIEKPDRPVALRAEQSADVACDVVVVDRQEAVARGPLGLATDHADAALLEPHPAVFVHRDAVSAKRLTQTLGNTGALVCAVVLSAIYRRKRFPAIAARTRCRGRAVQILVPARSDAASAPSRAPPLPALRRKKLLLAAWALYRDERLSSRFSLALVLGSVIRNLADRRAEPLVRAAPSERFLTSWACSVGHVGHLLDRCFRQEAREFALPGLPSLEDLVMSVSVRY